MTTPASRTRSSAITPPKAELLRLLVETERRERSASEVIHRRAGDETRLPLSYAQERLWFLDQLGLVGAAYNILVTVKLEGPLDVAALERSFVELVRRHESLRTRFENVAGQGVQVIDPPGRLRLEMIDLSGLAEADRGPVLQRASAEEAQHRFDLARGPLLRVRLLRFGVADHVVMASMHHIVSDAWSQAILTRELGVLYEAFAAGRASPLPELAIQYADYALWQRGWLQGEVLEQQLGYWRERLCGAPAALELPTDRPRPAVPSYRGETVSLALDAELSARLMDLARSEGATLYMVLLTAFQVLLSRWSGQDDIVVGTPIAGRRQRETEGLIGFFLNTLVMRTDLSGDPAFRMLLRRVKDVALGAYAHQDVPFEKLVEMLQPARDLSRQPIFQAMLTLQNVPRDAIKGPRSKLRRSASPHVTSKVDLSVVIMQKGKRLRVGFEYATDLFDRTTIERLAAHFGSLLTAIAASPDSRLSQLPTQVAADRDQIAAWNDTAADYPSKLCIHDLLARQALRTPDAVALIYADQQLSYHELDRRSNQLAHHLCTMGVGPETVVGLCVERSLEMVVGLLGILKAGGAYLPLDPSYPRHRLAYMMEEAGVRVVVTCAATEAAAPATQSAQSVRLDVDWPAIASRPATPAVTKTDPANLAYVIYTSGSTGRPKGVAGTHRAVVNRLLWDIAAATIDELYAQKTTINFIDALWELLMPLTRGQRTLLIPEGDGRDVMCLLEALSTAGVTRIVLVPSLLRALLEIEQDLKARLPWLRYWSCSGEALDRRLVETFRRAFPGSLLVNLYGTSEFWDASWCDAQARVGSHEPSIGKLLPNMQAHVLDPRMSSVPIGVAGELYVGGAGLARGYLNRPGLTAERFRADPFGTGGRLCRTGDRVRWRPDGELEFLGRVDRQVNIRGYRIELGEVEDALRSQSGIATAIAAVDEDGAGGKRLVAYIVPEPPAVPEADALRAGLKTRLPEHMIPSVFMHLDEVPLKPNGKIDYDAISSPIQMPRAVRGAALRTSTEKLVAAVWSEVLRTEDIGLHDNFFELGGHSLLLLPVRVSLQEKLSIPIALTDLFRYPTIYTLAQHLGGEVPHETASHLGQERAERRRLARRRANVLSD